MQALPKEDSGSVDPPAEVENPHAGRHIRSFVMRRGHLSDSQREAHETLLPHFGVPAGEGPINFPALFGRHAPVVLEIGFGMGHTTAQIAMARPELDFLGIEVYTPGVGSLLRTIRDHDIGNLRIIQQDAVEVLRDRIASDSLAGVHIYFPDPWPKLRHHKRRLIQPAFVADLSTRIAPGGYLHCATDWQSYADQMLEVLQSEPQLRNRFDGFAPRPDWRPLTKFEQRGLRLGHGVWDLLFERGNKKAPG